MSYLQYASIKHAFIQQVFIYCIFCVSFSVESEYTMLRKTERDSIILELNKRKINCNINPKIQISHKCESTIAFVLMYCYKFCKKYFIISYLHFVLSYITLGFTTFLILVSFNLLVFKRFQCVCVCVFMGSFC